MALHWKSKKLLAIDWDNKILRMVLIRSRGTEIELLKAVSLPVPPEVSMQNAASLGAFLREAVHQSRMGARSAIMSMPRERVVLNTMKLPPTPADELAALVTFQISKELPFAADQATIDFSICGRHDPQTPCNVLVAAVRNQDLNFYTDVAREAGISCERIGLRPDDNLLAVLSSFPELADRSILMIEVGPLLTEIDIVQSKTLTFSRAASVPLPNFFDQPSDPSHDLHIEDSPTAEIDADESSQNAVSRLMVDIIRSFEAHRATDPKVKIDQIVVCGTTGLESALAQSLAARFSTPFKLFSPNRVLGLSKKQAQELSGCSAVLGLALGQGRRRLESFDFLHPIRPISKRTLRMKKMPAAIMTAVLLIGSGTLYHYKFIAPKQDEVTRLKKLVAQQTKRKKTIEKFSKQVKALEEWKRSELYWPEVLAALTRNFPPDQEAFITRLNFDTRSQRKSVRRISTLKIKLRSAHMAQVNALTESLRSLGFTNVVPGQESQSSMSRRGQEAYRYDASVFAQLPLRTILRERSQPIAEQFDDLQDFESDIPARPEDRLVPAEHNQTPSIPPRSTKQAAQPAAALKARVTPKPGASMTTNLRPIPKGPQQ